MEERGFTIVPLSVRQRQNWRCALPRHIHFQEQWTFSRLDLSDEILLGGRVERQRKRYEGRRV